jgi:hypothetical protein
MEVPLSMEVRGWGSSAGSPRAAQPGVVADWSWQQPRTPERAGQFVSAQSPPWTPTSPAGNGGPSAADHGRLTARCDRLAAELAELRAAQAAAEHRRKLAEQQAEQAERHAVAMDGEARGAAAELNTLRAEIARLHHTSGPGAREA